MKQRHDVVRLRACLALAAVGTMLASDATFATSATRADAPPIAWTTCAAERVDARLVAAMGSRLQCGTMVAPLDADAPDNGTFTVGLVRVKAGQPAERRGALFFNFGGPGANPLDFLPPTAYVWATQSVNDPVEGDKRRLADRYDLVAVVPRGLRGGTLFACASPPADDTPDPTIYLADWNWVGIVKDAKAYANACAGNALLPHVGTLQHVRDMEQARVALGEPVMNFLGISYGSWVGAFYAAMYPSRTGRVVLDSVMNFSGTFEGQFDETPKERQAQFARNALRPALARPQVYDIGSDPVATMARFRAMPYQAREFWASIIDAPTHLVAALTLADWMREAGDFTGGHLIERARRHVFSGDPAMDRTIRRMAVDLASRLGTPATWTTDGLVDVDVHHAVLCGDTPWQKSHRVWRAKANEIAAKYPAANGMTVMTGLYCANWAGVPRWRPPLAALAKAPPLLMVQAEFDASTPYDGAMRAFNASPGAYIVLALGLKDHALFGNSTSLCVEHAVGRYLLTGELPATHFSMCDNAPMTPQENVRNELHGPPAKEVRAELLQRLRRVNMPVDMRGASR